MEFIRLLLLSESIGQLHDLMETKMAARRKYKSENRR